MSRALRVSDASFQREVLESDIPVLVEFWGSWCPPCKMMEPLLSEMAGEYAGRIKVCKINADQNPRTAARYTIQGVPTFIVLEAGQVKGRRVGAQSRGQLQALLEEAQVLGPTSGKSPTVAPGPEAAEGQDSVERENEEQILERLRALGYVD